MAAECPVGPRRELPLWLKGPGDVPAPSFLAGTQTRLPDDTLGGSAFDTQVLWAVSAFPVGSHCWATPGPLATAPSSIQGRHALLEPRDGGFLESWALCPPGAETEAMPAGPHLGACGRGSWARPLARVLGLMALGLPWRRSGPVQPHTPGPSDCPADP